MDDPLAFYLTWVTYGTWLPGDARGWVEYQRGWQLPDSIRAAEAAAIMSDDACRLSWSQRKAVEAQIRETCRHRGWYLHTVNCRSNHVHVVVTAPNTAPKKVRMALKAWATRCLREKFDPSREKWWAERGSIRWVYGDEGLETVIHYVEEAQDQHEPGAPSASEDSPR